VAVKRDSSSLRHSQAVVIARTIEKREPTYRFAYQAAPVRRRSSTLDWIRPYRTRLASGIIDRRTAYLPPGDSLLVQFVFFLPTNRLPASVCAATTATSPIRRVCFGPSGLRPPCVPDFKLVCYQKPGEDPLRRICPSSDPILRMLRDKVSSRIVAVAE
jgi:hypothetical protein